MHSRSRLQLVRISWRDWPAPERLGAELRRNRVRGRTALESYPACLRLSHGPERRGVNSPRYLWSLELWIRPSEQYLTQAAQKFCIKCKRSRQPRYATRAEVYAVRSPMSLLHTFGKPPSWLKRSAAGIPSCEEFFLCSFVCYNSRILFQVQL